MIAEAWAKRRYEAAFVSKVSDALGEATETQAWLDHALDSSYITSMQFREPDAKWQQIGAMLNKMTERAHDFCKSQTR
jgi:four helix bundle protein